MHRSWLELVDTDGPFLAIAPLKRVWTAGMPDFRNSHPDRYAVLADAHRAFVAAWDKLDLDPTNDKQHVAYREERDAWVEAVLRDIVGWGESLAWGEVPGVQAQSPNHLVTVTAQAALVGADGIGAVVRVVDPVESLRDSPNDLWAANEIDRMEELLRSNGVPIGIVTDGRWWGLVSARPRSMPASGIVDALTWIEEPRTRDAFLEVVGRKYIIGGDPNERLPVLFEESIAAAEEITEALGVQVRRAVELLVQSFSESSLEARRRGLPERLPARTHDVYEAAVTVMMRTVFLLFAEERSLLPSGDLFDQAYGMSGELARLAAREAAEGEESLDSTSLSWHRLLATSNALYRGATFENLRMPAYGGSLFDPARFPWLTTTTDAGTLNVTVSDRVMLHVLRSVQLAALKGGEVRQISFRDIDVEQIGYIYEGLLGYTAVRVDRTHIGLKGTDGSEPEMPLETLEGFASRHTDSKKLAEAIRSWVEEDQPAARPQSAAAIAKGLAADTDPNLVSSLSQAVGGDAALRDRITPWLGAIRQDLRSHPFVVLERGLLVKETPSRKNAGAHYTPKSLAEEVVLYALQPLCYSPGPHQTGDESAWKLRASEEILDLKVADITCGSGAFLVAAARYLADRVAEAWISEDPENAHRKDLRIRAIRQVVANCLYGADINDMAVEMAKLSLWLVSLDRDLPFSFVDDKVFLGNSLLGLTSLDQLRALHIDPSEAPKQQALDLFQVDVDGIIRQAVDLRERLNSEVNDDDPTRSATTKRRQLSQLQNMTAQLRRLADGVIGAGLPLGGSPGRALDNAYADLRLAVKQALSVAPEGAGDDSWLQSIIDVGLTPGVETDYERWLPLHWVLEAPDVVVDRGGFDAVVGNPPFLGGTKISLAVGVTVREWLREILGSGLGGKIDVVAYFILRADSLCRRTGQLGLIATNTLGQGDTRDASLGRMLSDGFVLTRAWRSRSWPTKGANLAISTVWGTHADLAEGLLAILDGVAVAEISASLTARSSTAGAPIPLLENAGLANLGCKLRGQGFLVPRALAEEWISEDARVGAVLRPHLSGADLTSRPGISSETFVIDFNDLGEREASTYLQPWRHVLRHVYPERSNAKSRGLRERWWQFESRALDMRTSIAGLPWYIGVPEVSKFSMPVVVPPKYMCNHKVVVIGTSSLETLGILSSSVHWLWAVEHGGTLEDRPTYNPNRCFQSFPMPYESARLVSVVKRLLDERGRLQHVRGIGLTGLYNLVGDPDVDSGADPEIGSLRDIHSNLDMEVLRAYGWSDIRTEPGWFEFRGLNRWTLNPGAQDIVLSRLLEENHRRAALEAAAPSQPKRGRKVTARPAQKETLFL